MNGAVIQVFVANSAMLSCAIMSCLTLGLIRSRSVEILTSYPRTRSYLRLQRLGSNVYEVNPWLWQFGRGKPRFCGLTVEQPETMARKSTEQHKKAAETKWRHKAATGYSLI